MRTRISLAVGLALLALAVGVIMARSPAVVAHTNGVPISGQIWSLSRPVEACQANEAVPRGTTAIRFSIEALFGPKLTVHVTVGGELLTSGSRGSGWASKSVTVPVHEVQRSVASATVCVALARTGEIVYFNGGHSARSPLRVIGARSRGLAAVRTEYLSRGSHSWWSLASLVAGRMALGRAVSGTWIVGLVLLAMAGLTVGVSRLLLREQG